MDGWGKDCRDMSRSAFAVPSSHIEEGCGAIRPEMLTLITLDQEQIGKIVQAVPGRERNIQDVYPLSPLQEGMLFHYLLGERVDTYVLSTLIEFLEPVDVIAFVKAVEKVMARHDALRTAILWEHLPRPVQVVYRNAELPLEEVALDPHRDAVEQLREQLRPETQRMDLRRAPLVRLQVASEQSGVRRYAVLRVHHIICDHASLSAVIEEIQAYLGGWDQELPTPVPYRDKIAQVNDTRLDEARAFFRRKLQDIDAPTSPFEVVSGGPGGDELQQRLEPDLSRRTRFVSERAGVSPARLFHAAWALVLAKITGRDDVVFGTVLRVSQHNRVLTERMLGLSVNTLPLRLRLQGVSAREFVEQTSRELSELLCFGQVSLSMAQRCSGIADAGMLFATLLNFRHGVPEGNGAARGTAAIRVLGRGEARTSYPVTI